MQQSLQPKLSRRHYASVPYALQNNTVFKCTQNWVSVSDGSWIDNGSEFQSVGPETAKHLWPYLVVLECETARSPWAAEWRWPWLADSDTGEHSSARYVGAVWCRHLYTRTHTLYSILCWKDSQCSRSRMSVVMWSNFRLRSMIQAAALSTFGRGWTLAVLTRWRTLLQQSNHTDTPFYHSIEGVCLRRPRHCSKVCSLCQRLYITVFCDKHANSGIWSLDLVQCRQICYQAFVQTFQHCFQYSAGLKNAKGLHEHISNNFPVQYLRIYRFHTL